MIKNEYGLLNSQKMSLKSARKHVNILNVRLDSTSIEEVLNTIGDFRQSKHKFSLFTLNPEILVEAEKNKNFQKILNSADLSIPDGIGLKIAEP